VEASYLYMAGLMIVTESSLTVIMNALTAVYSKVIEKKQHEGQSEVCSKHRTVAVILFVM